ncbi:facilitated trehalose transporter Tret1-like isoform X2 [Hyalella azteca]|uniref:Facilitated trehalose transporter Tret1-like isoform X2 n=1 Tax=Hyalella azteca TaxID=294128 RepID=A0A8B7NNX7_HYAAZ|nr:facilitated trehalose transporter Tret1-like isoform X2 [Hyalella azteca]
MGSSTLDLIYGRSPHMMTQVIATIIVAFGPLATGLGKGYSSPAVVSMQDATSHNSTMAFVINDDQGSWVASLSLLGAFFGGVPGGLAMKFGRQKILLIVSLPFCLSWMLTVFANNVYMVYASAFLCGVCSAIISLVTPVYISEIAHPDIRGCLCSVAKLAANVGMLSSFVIGSYVNWRQLAMIVAIAPGVLFVLVWAIPETPSYLMYKEKNIEAEQSYGWLNPGQDVTQEIQTMKDNIDDMKGENGMSCYNEWRRDLIRPVLITCGLMVFQKFSGANAFNFYAVSILGKAFVGINPYTAAVVVVLVQIIAGTVSSFLIDVVGRLPLLIVSNVFMTIALAGFGTFLYWVDGAEIGGAWDWVPFTCALIFQVAFAVGISPISWLYIGELFPLKHRGLGAIANSVSYVCSFVSVKTFADFRRYLGLHGAFWLYAAISLVGLLFTIIFVPETKGKNLDEMQKKYTPQEKYTPIREHEIENRLIP